MRWAAAFAVWAACVALVAGAAWYAIDSAGRQVSILSGAAPAGATGDDSVVVRPAPAPTDDVTPTPDTTLGSATSTQEPPSEPEPSRSTPDDDPTDEPGDDPSTREPSRTATRTATRPAPSVTVRSRTVSTRGGTVTLTCTSGGEIDFAVRPAQGWSAHGERSGTGEVEVELERGAQKVEVHGHCVRGEPRVEVEDHDEEDEDD